MKRVVFLLSLVLAVTTVPGFTSGKILKNSCDNGFSSTLVLTGQEGDCFNYQLTVWYDGSGRHDLSNVVVEVPCGIIGNVSNNMGWSVEKNITDRKSRISGFKIDNISHFGGENPLKSFNINFSLCAEELTCACDLSSLATRVAYKAGINKERPTKNGKHKKDKKKHKKGKKSHGCIAYESVAVKSPQACPVKPLTPILECVEYDATNGDYIAHFGYFNKNDKPINIPVGSENMFLPGEQDQGQPTIFASGMQTDVFQVKFKGNNLVWQLTGPDGVQRTTVASNDPTLRCNNDPAGPTAVLTAAGDASAIQFCAGDTEYLNITISGSAPWHVVYTNGTENFNVMIDASPYALEITTPGTYSLVSVSDANGNTGTVSGSVEATHYEIPTATISGGGAICDQEYATINLSLTGAAPWNITYTDGTNTYNETISSQTYQLQVNQAGTYTLLNVADVNCSGTVTGSAIVSTKDQIEGTLYLQPEYCMGTTISLASSVQDNGYTYLWTTTGNGELLYATSNKARYETATGDNNVTFTLHINDGCNTSELTGSTTINDVNADYVVSPAATNGQITSNLNYTFSATYEDADVYDWIFSDGTTANTFQVDHTFTETGFFTLSLAIWDNDCYDKTIKQFEVIAGSTSTIYVSNTLSTYSTDGDDAVKVYGDNIVEDNFSFEVYDRWGTQVYKTTDLNKARNSGWKGRNVRNSVYAYILKGRFKNGEDFVKTGRIMLAK